MIIKVIKWLVIIAGIYYVFALFNQQHIMDNIIQFVIQTILDMVTIKIKM